VLGQRHCAPDKPLVDALGTGLAWFPCKAVGTPGEPSDPPPNPFPLYLAGWAPAGRGKVGGEREIDQKGW